MGIKENAANEPRRLGSGNFHHSLTVVAGNFPILQAEIFGRQVGDGLADADRGGGGRRWGVEHLDPVLPLHQTEILPPISPANAPPAPPPPPPPPHVLHF